MTAAGRAGIPQLVAPGCYDLVDFVGWQAPPSRLAGRPSHAHNRLLTSAVLDAGERREVARAICAKLAPATAPVALMLPTGGCNEWDRPGADLHDAEGLAAFCDEIRASVPPNVALRELDCHINDIAFSDTAIAIVDAWLADGTLPSPA